MKATPAATESPPGLSHREILPFSAHEVIERIARGPSVATIKLNHGFWERIVCLEDDLGMHGSGTLKGVDRARLAEALDRLAPHPPWPVTLLAELLTTVESCAAASELLVLASPFGWRDGEAIEGTPVVGLHRVRDAIDRYIPARVPVFDGLVFKNAIEDGTFVRLVDELRSHPVVIAAPEYARGFSRHAELPRTRFVAVHEHAATWEAPAILERITQAVRELDPRSVVLIEAGGVTSSWLCARLVERCPGTSSLALGQALNLFAVEQLRNTNWFCVSGHRILATARAINPEVDELWRRGDAEQSPSPFWRPIDSTTGRDLALSTLTARAAAKPPEDAPLVPFVERKPIDWALVDELLGRSEEANRFANFGPVSRLLEEAVRELLVLPPAKEVVACKSATDALHLLVGVHEYRRGQPLRWVISAFGFFSTAVGPLAGATVLDCDRHGMLDLERLDALPDGAWDGLILTNPFGLGQDIDGHVELCRRKGKAIVVDNAVALFSATRLGRDHLPDEVVSFHHTKPWGIGEGGCMIVDANDAAVARSLANFGVGLDLRRARPHARNSKYSDYDSALVLQRLVNLPRWADLYRLQGRRILSIARRAGLRPLAPVPEDALLGSLPLLAPAAVEGAQLANPHLALRKYYTPLADGAHGAADIYRRIVSVPCHPGVAECPPEALEALFARLRDGG